jgi:hypothetical protein
MEAEKSPNSFSRVVKILLTPAHRSVKNLPDSTVTPTTDPSDHADWLKQKALAEMVQHVKAGILHWQQLDPQSQQIAEHMFYTALRNSVEYWQDSKNDVATALAQKASEAMYQKWLGGTPGIYLEGHGRAAKFFASNALSVRSLSETIQKLHQQTQETPQLKNKNTQDIQLSSEEKQSVDHSAVLSSAF